MARFDPERLTTLALLALEDAAHQGRSGIVQRTWGIRLALAWLHGARLVCRSDCDEFWRLLADPDCHQSSETGANVCRGQHLSMHLSRMYRSAGVERTPDMMFTGSAGRLPKRTWVGSSDADERVADLPEL